MSVKKINIQNFTVFKDFGANLAKGINVFIGENGTGKTHLLKLIYTMILATNENSTNFETLPEIPPFDGTTYHVQSFDMDPYFGVPFKSLMNTNFEYPNKITLIDDKNKNSIVKFDPYFPFLKVSVDYREKWKKSIFIPAKDMLTHSKGFMSMYEEYSMPFDDTYYDIIKKALLPNLKEIPQIGKNILPILEKIIGGKVIVENETFFIEKTDGRKINFSVEAEGIKKIAILWQLIMNKSIAENSVLIWDEPEANINPKLMKSVAEILLELSRQGVQIFVASHNYIFAKYIEVLMQETDEVLFHALYKTQNDGVLCETESKFSLLNNNSIIEESISLYEKEIEKAME